MHTHAMPGLLVHRLFFLNGHLHNAAADLPLFCCTWGGPDCRLFLSSGQTTSSSSRHCLGRYPPPIPDALILQVLEKASAAKGVLVTAGELGCSYAFKRADGQGNHCGNVPVLEVKVEDTTGAGDAFLAGFLFGMLQVDTNTLLKVYTLFAVLVKEGWD